MSRGREFVSTLATSLICPALSPLHSNPLGEAAWGTSGPLPYLVMPVPLMAQTTFRPPVAVSPRFTPTGSVFPFRIPPSTNTHRSGLFRRARWCWQHTLPISRRSQRLPVHSRRRVRGRLPSSARARTRRGCHHREHLSHSPNSPLIPCSVRNSTPRAVVVPETYPDLVPVPEVRD